MLDSISQQRQSHPPSTFEWTTHLVSLPSHPMSEPPEPARLPTPMPDIEEQSALHAERLAHAALYYTRELGRAVVPLKVGLKAPSGGNGWNVWGSSNVFTDGPTAWAAWHGPLRGHGIGMLCCYESRTLVLDIDVKHGARGVQSLLKHQQQQGALPATMRNNSPSGGYHLIYKVPDDWQMAVHRIARFSVDGMEILFNGRQAVMAPTITTVDLGGQYALDPENGRHLPIATLEYWQVDRLLYGRDIEPGEERTRVVGEAHLGRSSLGNEERNKLADRLLQVGSTYATDNFGRSIVEKSVLAMYQAMPGTRYPTLKQQAKHIINAVINDGAMIKLDDAFNELMEAYVKNQESTGDMSQLEGDNAEDTIRWVMTVPEVVDGMQAVAKAREWRPRKSGTSERWGF